MAALVRHRYYIKGDNRGVRADLSFRNLSELNISKHVLTNAVFRGANLAGTNLSECDLSGADFFCCDLEGADLQNATLTGADFRGANLTRAVLTYCKLQGADFSAGGASGKDNTRLTEAKLGHASLCQANLKGCDLSGAELVDADLSGADLSQAMMIATELTGANLSDVKLSSTILELSRLSHAQRANVPVEGVVKPSYDYLPPAMIHMAVRRHEEWIAGGGQDGKRLDFEGNQNLAGARFRRCQLVGIDLASAILDMADLAYSELCDANLTGASLRGTTLRGADLSRANLTGAQLVAMVLKGNKTWPTVLDGALLRFADLSNASFSHAVMNYADIGGSILSGTNFIEVDLSKVKKSVAGQTVASAPDKRMAVRYSEPRLFVKTPRGVFPSVNWSLSGICLSYNGSDRMTPDADIAAKVVADGRPPAKDAKFTVIRDDPERGVVLLKFTDMDDTLAAYLKSLVT